jgi:threonine/homoserine/homoserine lactone efflux protein
MELITLTAIASASALNSAMPGPCVALTVGRSARDGLRAGLSVTLGVLAANVALAALAMSIMLGVLNVSPGAFTVMKWVGAGALVALALKMLLSRPPDGNHSAATVGSPLPDLAAGTMVGLSSPFNLIFLLALLPQLVPSYALDMLGIGLVVGTVVVGAAISQLGASFLGAASGGLLNSGRRIECAGSLSMMGFAILALATPLA